jgi:gliding motility-associated-like protein
LVSRTVILSIVFTLITTFSVHGQVQLEPACAESVERYGVSGLDNSNFYWFFNFDYGEILDGDGPDTVTIHWYYSTGPVQIEVRETTNPAGCVNNTLAFVEIMAPDVNLGDPFPEICEGDTLSLDAGDHYEEPYDIIWHNNSTSQYYPASTSENIWVLVTDGFGCSRYDTVSLLVHPLPAVYIGEDTVYCNESAPLTLDPGDFAAYEWTTSSGASSSAGFYQVYPVTAADSIFLTATDYNNCPGTDTLIVLPCDLEALFVGMPNTITPNNDDFNDVWNIPYMNYFNNAVLEIFDRWGRLVYRTTDVEGEPWDGSSDGKELPMDAYYFVLNLNIPGTDPIVGTVNIIK